jgi:hypothetical protein
VHSQPKSGANAKPKPATDSKAGSGRRARGTGRRGRGGARTGNRTKKTAEELDAEMVDYFQAPEGGAGVANGAAPATGDTNMDDDVLVGCPAAFVRCTDADSDLQFRLSEGASSEGSVSRTGPKG